MKIKKILILLVLLLAIIAMSISYVSADYPTKYKVKTYTSYYSYKDCMYLSDEKAYVWNPKDTKNSIYANPFIREYRGNSKTKVQFYIYNNNGNKFHHVDCKSSKITIKYKIITNKSSTTKVKNYSYNKIPKYGLSKTITLSGTKNSKIAISSIKWSKVHRVWNHDHSTA